MEMQYFKEYSPALGREMECKVYGHGGRPMLYIPCQDGRFFDFEDFHMADTLAPWIESAGMTCPASSPSAAASARPMRSTFTSAGPTSSAAAWPSAASTPPTTASATTWMSWCI